MIEPAQTPNRPPRVSVVIPTYNTARYIGEALDSVFAQDYSSFEIIVVNDGSPDTPELERVLESYLGRIQYIKKQNGGVASARNAGLRASTGDFAATLDSDDLWLPNFLSVQVGFLDKNPSIDLVYGNGIIFGGSQPDTLLMDASPSEGEVNFVSLVNERCSVPTSGMLARREALVSIGLLDEQLRWGEDFDLWLRVVKGGFKISYHREVIFRYRRHSGGVSSQPTTLLKHAVTVLTKMLKHFDLTPEERKAAEETRQRFEARILFSEGKTAFEQRDFATAVNKLAKANLNMRQPRLAVMVALLRVCPGLMWHARKLANRAGS